MKRAELRRILDACRGLHIDIGLDPGTTTGYAVRRQGNHRDGFLGLGTTTFWGAFESARQIKGRAGSVRVFIEDPSQNRFAYDRHINEVIGRRDRNQVAKILAVVGKIQRDAGGNGREAQLLAEGLHQIGIPVVLVRPTSRKVNAKNFRDITGHEGRSNEHGRDAGMLIIGR